MLLGNLPESGTIQGEHAYPWNNARIIVAFSTYVNSIKVVFLNIRPPFQAKTI